MLNTAVNYLHVVAAVIRKASGDILLAQRPAHKHQGGKWEFPGGKVEADETPLQALERELHEELGIQGLQAQPLIKVRHVYPERAVLLDVWEVKAFAGHPHGKEGQPVGWFTPMQLSELEFPPANYPIITAAQLPDYYLITPEPDNTTEFLLQLEKTLLSGVRLVQLRAKSLSGSAYIQLAREVISLTHQLGGKVILNSPPCWLEQADGLHLTSSQLQISSVKPMLGTGKWLSAACHSCEDLHKATQLGVNFALLSPVKPTLSHPGAPGLGWEQFQGLTATVNFPVYALGGMQKAALPLARHYGGRGIAAIRGLWQTP